MDLRINKTYEEQKQYNELVLKETEKSGLSIIEGLPRQITWNGTISCNMRCKMCQVKRSKNRMKNYHELPLYLFEKLAKHFFPTLRILNTTRRGEIFVDPNFPRIVELCYLYNVKLDINTNGILLSRRWAEKLIPLIHDIKVSIDGIERNTFEKIRNGGKLNRVLSNVKTFVEIRTQVAHKLEKSPHLSFEVTLMRSNIKQLPDLIRLAAEMGVDCVKGYHIFAFWPEFEEESLANEKSLYNEIFTESKKVAKELGVESKLALPFLVKGDTPKFRKRRCPRLWKRFWIDYNGAVLPCTHPCRRVMGNIFHDNLLDIWNSQTYQILRTGKDSMCHRCGWLLEKDPEDVSLIPYDDDFFLKTWEILKNYRTNRVITEKTVGASWEYLWSRRTAQMPLPSDYFKSIEEFEFKK